MNIAHYALIASGKFRSAEVQKHAQYIMIMMNVNVNVNARYS